MAKSDKTSRVTFIVLRHMRSPIIMLVTIYAISMVGWVVIPGQDDHGNPRYLSFFHAFYFLTYTATTTGFGEIPYPFSDGQRMWGIVTLYSSVVAWLYAIAAIIGLVQNPYFQHAMSERRFAKNVRRIAEPFVIICGFGNTGSLLTRGLSDAGVTAVVLDKDAERIKALHLRDYRVAMPGLCADARVPEHLIEAGLLKPNCRAVVALTLDEEVNLKISVAARLLNPQLQVISQSTAPDYEEVLATLGGDIHIIDPFQTYAKYLGATVHNPAMHVLSQWLSGTPGATLDTSLELRRGRWILCGYGRMGRWIRESLESLGIETVVIEPNVDDPAAADGLIVGRATQATLQAADIEGAAGIVAGTNNDSDNLGILINARALNPDIFVVVRQNRHRNEVVFQAANADFIMQPSLVSARRILFLLIAPLLKTFFEHLRAGAPGHPDDMLGAVVAVLRDTVGGTRPRLWTVDTAPHESPALTAMAGERGTVALGDLMRDPVDRTRRLDCVPLVVQSADGATVMPEPSHPLRPGDRILLCGSARAHHLVDATLHNDYTLRYLVSGVDGPRGLVMRWLAPKLAALAGPAERHGAAD